MGRGYGRDRVDRLLADLRARWPGVAIRSTFIVGHPGETPGAYRALLDFVRAGTIDHLGVFAWSPEPGTRSVALDPRDARRVSPRLATARRDELMRAQATSSRRLLRARIGSATTFLPETWRRGAWHGRTPWQAPDGIDGETVVPAPESALRPGKIVPVRIASSSTYDLKATLL